MHHVQISPITYSRDISVALSLQSYMKVKYRHYLMSMNVDTMTFITVTVGFSQIRFTELKF